MKSMHRRTAAGLLLALLLSAGSAGCGRSKEKFKVPDIKMITPESVLAIDEPEAGHVWIVGDNGVIFYSPDGGQTWKGQSSGVQTLLCDVDFVDRHTGWVAGISGVMLHTSDGGETWVRQQTGADRHLLSVSFVDREYGWAIGDFATILHTSDGGKTWVRQQEEDDLVYSNVYFTDRENGWIVGERGIMLHTTNGGRHWDAVMPVFFERDTLEDEWDNPRPGLFGISFSDRNNGWICGVDATIMHTTDGGESWKLINSGQDILFNITIRGSRGWAVGTQGTYLLSRDGGLTWERQEEAIKTKQSFSNLFFTNEQQGWVAGAAGTLVRTLDGGETWDFYSGLSYEFEGIKMPEGLEKRIIE